MKNEQLIVNRWRVKITGFFKGLIAGFVTAAIIFGLVIGLLFSRNRDRELIKYEERQLEIEVLREDFLDRDSVEFLELPGVRRAADGASAEFNWKLDEILQRFRN